MTIAELIPYLIGAISTVFTWLIARRKNIADANSTELDNVEKAIAVYRNILGDLRTEIAQLRTEMAELSKQNNQLMKENAELKLKLESLERKLNIISN